MKVVIKMYYYTRKRTAEIIKFRTGDGVGDAFSDSL